MGTATASTAFDGSLFDGSLDGSLFDGSPLDGSPFQHRVVRGRRRLAATGGLPSALRARGYALLAATVAIVAVSTAVVVVLANRDDGIQTATIGDEVDRLVAGTPDPVDAPAARDGAGSTVPADVGDTRLPADADAPPSTSIPGDAPNTAPMSADAVPPPISTASSTGPIAGAEASTAPTSANRQPDDAAGPAATGPRPTGAAVPTGSTPVTARPEAATTTVRSRSTPRATTARPSVPPQTSTTRPRSTRPPSSTAAPTTRFPVAPTTASTTRSTTAPTTASTTTSATTGNGSRSGAVVWEDDFDTLDRAIWRLEHSTYGDGNNELQCYRPENVSVANGKLVLRAVTETYTCPNGSTREVTSGMVRSRGVTFSPGQAIEFRVKLNPADPGDQGGLWPAVWASGWAGGWPRGGEMDWLEVMTAENPRRAMFSMHYTDPSGRHALQNRGVIGSGNFSDSWHVVRFDYGRGGELTWYLDGVVAFEVSSAATLQGYPAPFDQAIGEIKINLALGGRPGPLAPGAVGTAGATFEVDYIRILQL